MAAVSEGEVERYFTSQVLQRGGLCVKFLPDYARGFPDRIAVFPDGSVIWVELKRPHGGRVSVAQKVAHVRLRKLHQRVEIVTSKAEADALLSEFT